jgi:hypothetical protein
MNIEIRSNEENEYFFHIDHDIFQGRLKLGSPKSLVYIFSDGQILDHFKLYGFKGALNLSKEFIKNLNEYNLSFNTNYKLIIKLLKNEIYSALSKIIENDLEFAYKHRNMIIKILLKNKRMFHFIKPSVKWKIPVKILGIGFRRLDRLKNKEVYIINLRSKYKNTGIAAKARLAASMGYYIVCVQTMREKQFVINLIGAKDLNDLSNSKLKRIKAIKYLTASEKQLLSNGLSVLNLLIFDNMFNIITESNKPDFDKDLPIAENQNFPIHNSYDIMEDDIKKSPLVKKLKLGLCRISREDINGLTNLRDGEIFLNLNSPIIKLMKNNSGKTQKIMLLEELSHEFVHILGYGLESHDLKFFKMQRILKYKCLLKL